MYIIINEDEAIKNFVIDCRDVRGCEIVEDQDIGAFVQPISKENALTKEDEKTIAVLTEKLKAGGVKSIHKHFRNLIGIMLHGNRGYALTLERFLHNFEKSCKDIKIITVPKTKQQVFIGSPLWCESTQVIKISWYGDNNLLDIKNWGIMPVKIACERLKDDYIQAFTHEEFNDNIDYFEID